MKNKLRKILLLSSLALAVLIFSAYGLFLVSLSVGQTTIDFLDVGQGDSILVREGWQEALIDGGPDRSVLSQLGKSIPFLDRQIEYVMATHPHDDHTKGLVDVLDRYQVGSLILPKATSTDRGFNDLLIAAEARDVPVRLVTVGDQITIGDSSTLTVLWPDEDCLDQLAALNSSHGEHDPNNTCSLIMRYEYCDQGQCSQALLVGDATRLSEELMIEQERIKPASLLKIGHHGSRFSTSSEFLKLVNPKNAVIQVGEKNHFGHPNYGVILRLRAVGAKVWRNDKDGSIRAVPEGGGFNVFGR